MPQKCNGCGYIKNLWVLLVSFLFYVLIKIYCTPWVYSVSVILFWNLKPAFRFKWKHKTAHRGTEPLCWLTSAGWSSVLTFIAEWQLKCLLKIKQKLCPGTVRVTRATLAAHEPEKPKIKKQKGKAQGVLGQISALVGLPSPSGLWLCPFHAGMGDVAGAGRAEGESTFARMFTGNPLWCGKIKVKALT